jgi:hypothetical protein
MRTRLRRLVLVCLLVLPTYAAAQGCGSFSGGFWPFGPLSGWCGVIRTALCAIGY